MSTLAKNTSNVYVALLRGVNVGGKKSVSMAKLKESFEKIGFKNVQTFINSGNVLFETAEKNTKKILKKIESTIEKDFGFEIRTVVRNVKQMTTVCKSIPANWANNGAMKTDVLFLWEEIDVPDVASKITKNPKVDTLIYVPGAIIWNVDRKKYKKSKMQKFIGTHIYKHMTARNVNTTRKLLELMEKRKNFIP